MTTTKQAVEAAIEACAKVCNDLAAEQYSEMALFNDERHGVYAKKFRKAVHAIRALDPADFIEQKDSVHVAEPADTATDASLKPCPFCGETEDLYHAGFISCENCGAQGPSYQKGGLPDYRTAWNHRPGMSLPNTVGQPNEQSDFCALAMKYKLSPGHETADAKRWFLLGQKHSSAQPVAQEPTFSECRHCGWECRPNDAQSKTFYPLDQSVAQEPVTNGFSYLVIGYGETEYPEIIIAETGDEAKEAVVAMCFDPSSDATKEDRENLLQGFDDPDNWDGLGEYSWKVEFEIGGVEVKKVFTRPAAVMAQDFTDAPTDEHPVVTYLTRMMKEPSSKEVRNSASTLMAWYQGAEFPVDAPVLSDAQPSLSDAEIAEYFHGAYERLAPSFGYETREASRKEWTSVPENNKALMTAVVAEVRALLAQRQDSDKDALSDAQIEAAIDAYDAEWNFANRGFENKFNAMKAALKAALLSR